MLRLRVLRACICAMYYVLYRWVGVCKTVYYLRDYFTPLFSPFPPAADDTYRHSQNTKFSFDDQINSINHHFTLELFSFFIFFLFHFNQIFITVLLIKKSDYLVLCCYVLLQARSDFFYCYWKKKHKNNSNSILLHKVQKALH